MKVNNYKIETVKCLICGYTTNNHQSFNSHIAHAHNIKSKDYYDTYIKTESDGICKTCGKPTQFFNMWKGYRDFCCNSCMSSNQDIQIKRKKTSQIHYGVDFPHQSQEVKTNMAKTNLDKFGAENIYASDYGKQKIKETLLDKYGVENIIYNRDTRCKMAKSRRKNGNNSSLEDYFEQQLINLGIKFRKQYFDVRYPFKCDFYLVNTDTFIEINNYWVHGQHFYDESNTEDKKVLDIWKMKAQTSDHYKHAIEIWTKNDINKRDTAIMNGINYIVLWNKEEIDNYLQTL